MSIPPPSASDLLKRLKRRLGPRIIRRIIALCQRIPLRHSERFGQIVGCFLYYIARSSNRLITHNLRIYNQQITPAEDRKLRRSIWRNLARVAFEMLHLASLSRAQLKAMVKIEGYDCREIRNQPAIYVSAHFGNWELFPRVMAAHGIPITYIYKAAKNRELNHIIEEIRQKNDHNSQNSSYQSYDHHALDETQASWLMINHHQTRGVRQIVELLNRGQAVGMLIDQTQGSGKEQIEFFGKTIICSYLAASLALKFRIPLILSRTLYLGDGLYKMVVERLDLASILAEQNTESAATNGRYTAATDNHQTDDTDPAREITQHLYSAFEEWIRRNPEQWLWLYPRWKDDEHGPGSPL